MASFQFDRAVFARTIRTVRRLAGLKQHELADRMQIPPRSYQHLEGGKHQNLDVAALFSVAEAAGADPYGMLVATLTARPEIAVRLAENKLVAAFLFALLDFNEVVGDEAAVLQAGEIAEAFRTTFKELARKVGKPYPQA